ncbi:helix-turn-helix transcriptional regulator [uncultured Alistipes sp.]|uniref:helix-turn-helix domain-containing protein n=1 Tax=uncultured Alistipes sp. TaxID=538949 RepID=UPI00262A4F5E|nr:helix-turn-helix transcriptional regulator [uncultured Alistipes sp.]
MKEQDRDNAFLEYIARKCKQLRAEKGVSQEAVYEDTHLHIGKIETAKKNLTVSSLSKLCNYFNVSLIDFLKDF